MNTRQRKLNKAWKITKFVKSKCKTKQANKNKQTLLQSNFIEIALWPGCSPVNLLLNFRTPFPKNTSGWLLLKFIKVIWSRSFYMTVTSYLCKIFNMSFDKKEWTAVLISTRVVIGFFIEENYHEVGRIVL